MVTQDAGALQTPREPPPTAGETAARQSDAALQIHESFLTWNGFFWARIAGLLCLAAIVAYVWHDPIAGPSGGTWLGYTLGTIAALLVLWLTWFGWRKRSYRKPTRVQAYLSAHVYFGLALIVLATLHTGFEFGWDVHTLAYGLMLLVIGSGLFGIIAYARYPRLMTENRNGATQAQMLRRLATLDSEMRRVALRLSDEIAAVVGEATSGTRLGGSAWRQLSGRDPGCSTAVAMHHLQPLLRVRSADEEDARALLVLLHQKLHLLRQLRRDIQLKALMEVWLFVHVPMSFALLAALVAHVVAVFFYF